MGGTRTFADAFADAAAGMVAAHHVGDVLAQLVSDCAEVTGADAVAILVTTAPGQLSLLSATSHEATLLEMLQIQSGTGPCLDCMDSTEPISAAGLDELVERWGEVGRAIFVAGFQRVDAYPMRWRNRALGGLNVFRSTTATKPDEVEATAQAFADVATLVLVQSSDVPQDQIAARVQEAVSARIQVEQAKGVLAQVHDIELAAAYELLRQLAWDSQRSLTETARLVVREQHS